MNNNNNDLDSYTELPRPDAAVRNDRPDAQQDLSSTRIFEQPPQSAYNVPPQQNSTAPRQNQTSYRAPGQQSSSARPQGQAPYRAPGHQSSSARPQGQVPYRTTGQQNGSAQQQHQAANRTPAGQHRPTAGGVPASQYREPYPTELRNQDIPTQKKRRKKKRHIFRNILLTLLGVFFALFLICGISGYILLSSIIKDAPDISSITVAPTEAATYIYDSAGKKDLKLTLPESNRDLVTIDQIPADLQHAFVAIEDSRFYEHNGIDLPGIARAFVVGVKNRSFSEGASTITQQLLKNSVFTGWVTESSFEERIKRKIQEQYLALQLEKVLTKEQILEDYLNIINLGAGSFGVQSAAFKYFGKDVSELTLSESAVIAGITQNPTRYNPIIYPENNAKRRKVVLDKMLEQNWITQAAYDEAIADDVYSRIQSNEATDDSATSIYTYYEDALIAQVIEDLQEEKGYTYQQAYKAVYTGGLRIYSAQDKEVQQICDEEFANAANFPDGTEVGIDYALSVQNAAGEVTNYGNDSLKKYIRTIGDPSFDLMYNNAEDAAAGAELFKNSVLQPGDTVLGERITITPQPQASVVIIDQKTGQVKAVVGGRGNKEASLTLNRATYTTRQPGSTFKILTTYAPAIDAKGKTLATVYDNAETTYTDGTPVNNWDLNNYTGATTIREAIVRSVNVVAVRCITEITPKLGFDYAQKFGISTLVESRGGNTDITQALALGGITDGVTALDLCGAYATIANNGTYLAPKFYTQVTDRKGNVILDHTAPAGRSVLEPSSAYLLTDAMKGVISDPQGTANGIINLGSMPVAGKSGTTSDYRDIWFAGYTPYYTCTVWGGYDNNAKLPSGGSYHNYNKVLWNSIMNRLHQGLPTTDFETPGDVVTVRICKDTKMAAAPNCPNTYEEKFAAGTQPDSYCNVHGDGSLVAFTEGAGASSTTDEGAITILSQDQTVIYNDNSSPVEDTPEPAPDVVIDPNLTTQTSQQEPTVTADQNTTVQTPEPNPSIGADQNTTSSQPDTAAALPADSGNAGNTDNADVPDIVIVTSDQYSSTP